MKIEYVDELLFANIKITYKGKTKTIDNVIVDTGAAHSLLLVDTVFTKRSLQILIPSWYNIPKRGVVLCG